MSIVNSSFGHGKGAGALLGDRKYLEKNGVELMFGYECKNIILENSVCKGVIVSNGKEELAIKRSSYHNRCGKKRRRLA